MSDTYSMLTVRMDGTVAIVAFTRPDAANALNRQMATELRGFFGVLPRPCRAVILTGQGKHFCAGADLKERLGMDEQAWHHQHAAFEGALHAILECELPVIAAVNGAAFGGGLELALACDFIYAADSARFALPEASLGIMPGMGGTQHLPRAIGARRAKELLFTAKPFSAQEAYALGMVNQLCAGGALIHEALACAHTIAANAPRSVAAIKRAINECEGLPLDDALQCELSHYHALLTTKDRQEGIAAFNEKRKPVFAGE